MMEFYYQLPFDTKVILSKQRHPLGRLEDSIRQHIHLILKTHYEEYRYDTHYGCYIWDKDFENIQSVTRWKDELEDLISKALKDYEKRLSKTNVQIEVDEPEMIHPKTQQVVKPHKRITIKIIGTLKKTNQPLVHTEYMFFSPLSLA